MKRSPVLLLLGLLLPQASSIAVVAVTAWQLGPAGRGEIAFAMSVANLIAIVGGWGFYLTAARRTSPIPRQYLHLPIICSGVLALIATLAALAAPSGLFTFQMMLAAGLAGVFVSGTTFSQRLSQAKSSDSAYLAVGATAPLLSIGLLIPATLQGATSSNLIIVWTGVQLVAFGGGLFILGRTVNMATPRPYRLGFYARTGVSIGLANVSTYVVMRADLVVLGLRSTAQQVGYYSMATALAGVLFLGPEIVSLRTISAYTPGDEPRGYVIITRRRARQAYALTLALAAPVAMVGFVVLTNMLPAFRPALIPFMMLSIASIPAAYSRIITAASSMLARNRFLSNYSLLGLLLAAAYLPAAKFGAIALAFTSLAIYTTQAAFVHRSWQGYCRGLEGPRS